MTPLSNGTTYPAHRSPLKGDCNAHERIKRIYPSSAGKKKGALSAQPIRKKKDLRRPLSKLQHEAAGAKEHRSAEERRTRFPVKREESAIFLGYRLAASVRPIHFVEHRATTERVDNPTRTSFAVH